MLKPEILLNWDIFDSKLPEDPEEYALDPRIPEEWKNAIPNSPNPRGMKIARELVSLIVTWFNSSILRYSKSRQEPIKIVFLAGAKKQNMI